MTRYQGIVADGYSRARLALESSIRAEVAAEFADRFAEVSGLSWLRLRWLMSSEIRRRLEAKAPQHACY